MGHKMVLWGSYHFLFAIFFIIMGVFLGFPGLRKMAKKSQLSVSYQIFNSERIILIHKKIDVLQPKNKLLS